MFKIAPQTVLVGPDDSPPSKFQFYTDPANAAVSCLKIKGPTGVAKLKFNTGGQLISQSYQTHEAIEEAKKAKLEGPQPAQEAYPAASPAPAPSFGQSSPPASYDPRAAQQAPPWPPQTQAQHPSNVNKASQFSP